MNASRILIPHATHGKPVVLAAVAPARFRVVVAQGAGPCESSVVLRGRPPLSMDTYVAEGSIVVAEAARKSSKTTAVVGVGVGAAPVRCAGFFHFPSGNTLSAEVGRQFAPFLIGGYMPACWG